MAMTMLVTGLLGLLGATQATVIAYTKMIPHECGLWISGDMTPQYVLHAVSVLHMVGIQEYIAEEFRDMPADFGPDFPFEGLRGLLAQGEPDSACTPLAPPPTVDNFVGKWIVLVSRYNCSFEEKVRNAQAAGYDCVIVHNVNSSELETMSASNGTGIIIPSVFVSSIAGEILFEKYLYNSSYYIMVNGDLPFNINLRLLWAFAVVVLLCLLVILVFLIAKCIKDRRRARRLRLPNRALKKIPTCRFSKGDPYDTCAICLDDYLDGDTLRVLPCAHAYHAKCIDQWLTQSRRVCPVCKRRVVAAGESRRDTRHSSDDSADDAPLLPRQQIDNGTFAPQRENPFVRAARLIARRRQRQDAAETPPPSEEHETINSSNDDIVYTEAETEPLVSRSRSHPRDRRSSRRTARSAVRAAPASSEDSGEIGVAAVPITAQSNSLPRHIDL